MRSQIRVLSGPHICVLVNLLYTKFMQNYEKNLRQITKRQIFFNNFLGGVAWGIGSALGAAIFVLILGYMFSKINIIPVVGSFVAQVQEVVQQKQTPQPAPTR